MPQSVPRKQRPISDAQKTSEKAPDVESSWNQVERRVDHTWIAWNARTCGNQLQVSNQLVPNKVSFTISLCLPQKAAGFSVMESGSSFTRRDPGTHRKSQLQLEARLENTSLICSVTTSSQQGQNATHHGGRRAASRTVHRGKTHPMNTILGGIWENLVMRCCALLPPLFCF